MRGDHLSFRKLETHGLEERQHLCTTIPTLESNKEPMPYCTACCTDSAANAAGLRTS
jgi:hypothetical protein